MRGRPGLCFALLMLSERRLQPGLEREKNKGGEQTRADVSWLVEKAQLEKQEHTRLHEHQRLREGIGFDCAYGLKGHFPSTEPRWH